MRSFYLLSIIFCLVMGLLPGCVQKDDSPDEEKGKDTKVVYNLIEPNAGIYAVIEKNVDPSQITGRYYEKSYYRNFNLIKIERYDKTGKLNDDLSVSAVTEFEYDSFNRVRFVRYFDKMGKRSTDKFRRFWCIEYIYDELGRVIMEIYRDKEYKLMTVPVDAAGKIQNVEFIPPVLVYKYADDEVITIMAFDEEFNLLKTVKGSRPCIPFIDCG